MQRVVKDINTGIVEDRQMHGLALLTYCKVNAPLRTLEGDLLHSNSIVVPPPHLAEVISTAWSVNMLSTCLSP